MDITVGVDECAADLEALHAADHDRDLFGDALALHFVHDIVDGLSDGEHAQLGAAELVEPQMLLHLALVYCKRQS